MRLGKEQAAGYVEDADTETTVVEELTVGQPELAELTAAPQTAVTVG
jgi:hypothetical protein